jgi:PEP-CTERM motif
VRTFRNIAVLMCLASLAASAGIVVQYTGGTEVSASPWFFGESFTTPAGGPWSNLAFNFFSNVPPVTPAAAGTAFLLTREYLGTPAGLSSGTAGFLAQPTGISGGEYLFAPSVTLQSSTTYYLYGDASMTISGSSIAGTPGAHLYVADTSSAAFTSVGGDAIANFQLYSGVPEPSTFGVFGLSVVGLALRRRFGH